MFLLFCFLLSFAGKLFFYLYMKFLFWWIVGIINTFIFLKGAHVELVWTSGGRTLGSVNSIHPMYSDKYLPQTLITAVGYGDTHTTPLFAVQGGCWWLSSKCFYEIHVTSLESLSYGKRTIYQTSDGIQINIFHWNLKLKIPWHFYTWKYSNEVFSYNYLPLGYRILQVSFLLL